MCCNSVCAWIQLGPPHLLIVVLPRHKVIHQSDPVAQLLAQGVQELVRVPAARWAGEGKQLLAAVQRVGAAVWELRGSRGALQADVGVWLHTALVVDLIHRSWERLLPGQGQARFTVTCAEGNQKSLQLAYSQYTVYVTLCYYRTYFIQYTVWGLIPFRNYLWRRVGCVVAL